MWGGRQDFEVKGGSEEAHVQYMVRETKLSYSTTVSRPAIPGSLEGYSSGVGPPNLP